MADSRAGERGINAYHGQLVTFFDRKVRFDLTRVFQGGRELALLRSPMARSPSFK